MHNSNPFKEQAENPAPKISEWKNQNDKKVLGYLCTYTPEEIMHAAGVMPYRIFGNTNRASSADHHLQAYSCSLVRSALGEALEGDLNFLDGMVFPHTCDSIQRLSDIWRLNADMSFHFDVVHPVKLNTPESRDYMYAVLERFRNELGKALGKDISDKDLSESIKIFNKLRSKLKELYEIRKEKPYLISGEDIYYVSRASMTMDREEFASQLEEFIHELNKDTDYPAVKAPVGIIMTGGICDHPDLYSILEEAGAYIMWDDLCSGYRSFNGNLDENIPPMESITKRYFERMECPAKHRGIKSRYENLSALIKEHKPQGVIILQLKFCDPHSFDYPYIKEHLDQENISSLYLEIEEPTKAGETVRTRLETFVEMLS